MKRLLCALTLLLASCTLPATLEPPPETSVVGPQFSDPEALRLDAPFDLVAEPGGTGDCLTLESACNLQSALGKLGPGQTLVLRGGLYSGYRYLNSPGSAGDTVTVRGYPGERPVIDGSTPGEGPLLTVTGSNLLLRDVALRYARGTTLLAQGSRLTLSNVELFAGAADGLVIRGDNVFVQDVTAHHLSGTGIVAQGRGHTLTSSSVYHSGTGVRAAPGAGLFEFLRLSDNTVGIRSSGNIVRFNVAWDNGDNYHLGAGGTVYNNTSVRGERGFVTTTQAGETPAAVYHNLSFDEGNNLGAYDVYERNSWQLGVLDPQFVSFDPESRLFARLSESSPAVDVPTTGGIPLPEVRPYLGAFGAAQP